MNDIYRQAPELRFTRGKLKNSKSPSYFGWEPEIWKAVNKELSGKEGNCIKLINILLGTAEGFKVSQKWICEMAGLSKDGYYKARKKLEEKKMLIYDETANTITIDTKGMLDKYSPKEEKNEGMLEKYPVSMSEKYPEGMREEYPESISETYYNKKETNKEQKKINRKETEAFSASAEKSSYGNLSQAKAPHSNPVVSKEKRERLMSEPMSTGWGAEMDEWLSKQGNVYNPHKEWPGF